MPFMVYSDIVVTPKAKRMLDVMKFPDRLLEQSAFIVGICAICARLHKTIYYLTEFYSGTILQQKNCVNSRKRTV